MKMLLSHSQISQTTSDPNVRGDRGEEGEGRGRRRRGSMRRRKGGGEKEEEDVGCEKRGRKRPN